MKQIVAIGVAALTVVLAPVAHAQYTADFQTNAIIGVLSNWSGSYVVGSNTFADALVVQSSGALTNASGYLGYEASASNNSVLVSDGGSVWNNTATIRPAVNVTA